MNRALPALAAMLVAAPLAGCAAKIDRYLVRHPIAETLRIPDVDLACRAANGTLPIAAGLSGSPRAYRAMVILHSTAGICAQQEAMEAQLQAERALYWLEGERRLAAVKDARLQERRHHTVAAARAWRAFTTLDEALGPIGEECPTLRKPDDELTWFLGLVAGASALLEDQAGGGEVGVPIDVLRRVGRGVACLDDETWWHVPGAIQAGVWVVVPGTGPEGVDPFDALDEAARKGSALGVNIARSLQVRIASNAGRDDQVRRGLTSFAEPSPAPPPEIALLEAYGRMVARHEADLVWTRARGYRAADLGSVPGDGQGQPEGSGGQDPFEGDPFAQDPFAEDGGDPFADDAPGPDTDTPDPETP